MKEAYQINFIGEQKSLMHKLNAMKVNSAVTIDRKYAEHLYPATGRYSGNEFLQLALAVGGHRPEPDMSSADLIQRELGGDYAVSMKASTGDYKVLRLR